MFLDINGPDFLRVQKSATSRSADPLDPDVFFSGNFDDGQVLVFQQAVSNSGTGTSSYTLPFGQTFDNVPLVLGGLKLSQAVSQNGGTLFNAGEIVAPCAYYYNAYAKGRIIGWDFSYIAYKDKILLNTAGFNGTAIFLVVDL